MLSQLKKIVIVLLRHLQSILQFGQAVYIRVATSLSLGTDTPRHANIRNRRIILHY